VGNPKAELYEIAARQGRKAYENHRLPGSQKRRLEILTA
jgi:hypothetical protein